MSSTAALRGPIGARPLTVHNSLYDRSGQILVLILINARGARPTAIFGCHGNRAFHRR
jgi:hypothetical protein